MLRSQQQVRLFGLRYGFIFAGLAALAIVLIVVLLLNFPQTQDRVPIADTMSAVSASRRHTRCQADGVTSEVTRGSLRT